MFFTELKYLINAVAIPYLEPTADRIYDENIFDIPTVIPGSINKLNPSPTLSCRLNPTR